MVRTMNRHALTAFWYCCLLGFLLVCNIPIAQAFQVTAVTAEVSPVKYTGMCPHTVVFSGTITVDGPGTVTYRWEHSPGTGYPKQISFDQAGTQTVKQEMHTDHHDYLALITDSPNTHYALAGYKTTCTGFKPDLTVNVHGITNHLLPASGLKVNVVNAGKGAYQPPPATRVVAKDRKGSVLGTAKLNQAIPGNGGRTQVTIQPVNNLSWHAVKGRLTVVVDDLQLIDEVKEDNNTVVIGK